MFGSNPPQNAQSLAPQVPLRVGRYTFFGEIASGGMASVFLGRMSGQAGFSKTVAIKRPHPHLIKSPEFARMIVDEARLAARIQHPNVVATLDCVADAGELFLVMDYVHGESLWHLLAASAQRKIRVPPAIVASIMVNVLHGLHAAHEATDEQGRPLAIVHRDVSPQNVLVGVDGVARVLDFGVAKATGRLQSTHEGQLKGKFAYMAPEQVSGAPIDRRTDIYAASALLWGALVGRRLIEGRSEAELLNNVLQGNHSPPSFFVPGIGAQIDAVVMRGLAKHPDVRYQTAREMATAVENVIGVVSPFEVGEWVKSLAAEAIELRSSRIREMESASDVRIAMHEGVAEIVHAGQSYESYDVYPPPAAGPHQTGQSGHTVGNAPTHLASAHPSHHPSRPPPYGGGAMTTPGIYVSAGAQEAPRRSMSSLVGVAALVFVATFGGTLYWRYGLPHPGTETGVPATTAPPPPAAVESAPPPPPIPSVAVTVTATPSASASSSSKVVSTKASSSPTTKSTATAPTTVVKVKKPKADCETQPFTVDSDGIKHVRPECQ